MARDQNSQVTSSAIEAQKNSQGPKVDRTKQERNIDRDFSEQRDTLKPQDGVQMAQQKAVEMKEQGREGPKIDLSADTERTDMPVPPAEIKGGMRK